MRLVSILVALACMSCTGRAEEKREFGFYSQLVQEFRCDEKHITPRMTCSEIPPEEEMTIVRVIIDSFSCNGPLDKAHFKRGDILLAIDGEIIHGMKPDAYTEMVRKAAKQPSSMWTILRISESGHRTVYEKSVTAMPQSNNEDFDSCGEPDPEA